MRLVADGCLVRFGALLQHETQCPEPGIGAAENKEDHDQHKTTPECLSVLADLVCCRGWNGSFRSSSSHTSRVALQPRDVVGLG